MKNVVSGMIQIAAARFVLTTILSHPIPSRHITSDIELAKSVVTNLSGPTDFLAGREREKESGPQYSRM